jgi:hypothetical protein
LAKKQQKTLESFAWIPPQHESNGVIGQGVNFRLTSAGGGATAIEQQLPIRGMPSYEYFFVVLSKGSRFDYLSKRLDSIRLHRARPESGSEPKFYEVVTIPSNKRPALPSNSLYWTSIAYLLWDESDPTLWDIDQQQALIDWLHWGGQIIVSGPDALTQLQNSFLRTYLPASVEKARTFTAADLDELQYWAGANGHPPRLVHPWPGAVLKKDPSAECLAETPKDTVIERRVGRGRIVVTAFRITGSDFYSWEGCDSFFNACLMRRPARRFSQDSQDLIHIDWLNKDEDQSAASRPNGRANRTARKSLPQSVDGSDPASINDDGSAVQATVNPVAGPQIGVRRNRTDASVLTTLNARQSFLDAKKCTSLRYFSRDAGQPRETYAADVMHGVSVGIDDSNNPVYGYGNGYGYNQTTNIDDELDPPAPDQTSPGLCAWSDFNPTAQSARWALDNATGLTVPDRRFIMWVVVGYICVLVPVNWLLFRLIRRVEWAWIAAPLIAIGCTVVVVKLAQLNIGFARSRNEIAVVEMQPGYSRAHKTYYTALYTSLATTFELQLADPGGQILPFPTQQKLQRSFGETNSEVVCRRGDDTRLTGFHIGSNSNDYVHSEEMADFGGVVSLHRDSEGGMQVTNGTKHPLENCRVIEIANGGGSQLFTLPRLEPGATAQLKNPTPLDRSTPASAVDEIIGILQHNEKRPDPSGELNTDEVANVACGLQEMRPGEVCLVGRIADEVSGLTVTPHILQYRQAALLVAHLDPGKLPDPRPDDDKRQKGRPIFSLPPDDPPEDKPDTTPSTP